MQPKCDYCDFFGEKYHCNNCKLFNRTRTTRLPQEIDCTLEELVEYINGTEDVTERFMVGDYKTIELYTGEEVKMILLDVEKDTLANGGTAKTTFGILQMDDRYRMNPTNTNRGGFAASTMNTVTLERIFRLLPDVLKQNIKLVNKKTTTGETSPDILTSVHQLFLFSEVEIKGDTQYSYAGEGEQYEYFATNRNRHFEDYTWLRSPSRGYGNCFCCVYGSDFNYDYASSHYAVAFGFCI